MSIDSPLPDPHDPGQREGGPPPWQGPPIIPSRYTEPDSWEVPAVLEQRTPAGSPPELLISLLRTVVPFIVAWAITQAARIGLDLSASSVPLEQLVTLLVAAVYYYAVRWLETHRSSKWGRLLGAAKRPLYDLGRQVIDQQSGPAALS